MKQDKNSKQKQMAIADAEQKIALLEKSLAWEKMRADTLDTMITIAEKELSISTIKNLLPNREQVFLKNMRSIAL